jgi:hypothetical protein
LVGTLARNAQYGWVMQRDADLEKKIAALTPADIQAALDRHVNLNSVSYFKGGDFQNQPAGDAAAEVAPPPIPPPPPPPDDAPPKTVKLGETKDAVIADFGEPKTVAKTSAIKEIYVYPDFKVTFTNGKVTDIQ